MKHELESEYPGYTGTSADGKNHLMHHGMWHIAPALYQKVYSQIQEWLYVIMEVRDMTLNGLELYGS